MNSLESVRGLRHNFNIFRSKYTLFRSNPTSIFYSNVTPLKKYGRWSKLELPLLPKVAFVHKIMKLALDECECEIPESYIRKVRENLTEIRKVNWNAYNTKEMSLREAQKVKKLLEDLKEREQDLPAPLAKKLENFCLFGSLQDAIDCLNDRNGLGRA